MMHRSIDFIPIFLSSLLSRRYGGKETIKRFFALNCAGLRLALPLAINAFSLFKRMSSQKSVTGPAKVSREALMAIMWAGVSISFCLLAFRGYVRLKVFRRFFLDDILVLSAWLIFLAHVILNQIVLPTLYLVVAVNEAADKGELTVLPEGFQAKVEFLFHTFMANSFAFWCCLWAIKASFLGFFRKLGHNVARQNVLWWCALSATVIGFVITIAIWDYKCFIGNIPINTSQY